NGHGRCSDCRRISAGSNRFFCPAYVPDLFARNNRRRPNAEGRLYSGSRNRLVIAVEDVYDSPADHTGKRIGVDVRWKREVTDVLVILDKLDFLHEERR